MESGSNGECGTIRTNVLIRSPAVSLRLIRNDNIARGERKNIDIRQ